MKDAIFVKLVIMHSTNSAENKYVNKYGGVLGMRALSACTRVINERVFDLVL